MSNAISNDLVVYLINQTVNGSPERQLAAKFILDCLRKYKTREDIAACIHQLVDEAILDVGEETRELTANLGLMG